MGGWRMAIFIGAILALAPGCTSLRYVTQAAAGQYELVSKAEPIDELVAERRVGPRTRSLLSAIPEMKRFGEAHGLKATKNYTSYVTLHRPAVVWVVTAAEPLAFESKSWSFPIVGSFNYLGWFKEDEARAFAKELAGEGWDIDVRGSPAYSTTGFFRDPVLSTMIPEGRHVLGELANTILHESTHATIFVRHQSVLNESIANWVGDHMALDFLRAKLGDGSKEEVSYLETEGFFERRGKLLHEGVVELEALYASKLSREEKLAKKKQLLIDLRKKTAYSRPITNATLIQYRTYNSGQEELGRLFEQCGRDWKRFVGRLKKLERAKFEEEQLEDVGPLLGKISAAPCD